MELSLQQIAQWTEGTIHGENITLSDISTDTRSINAGSLFVPLKGERFDGHDYVKQAIEKGARAFLWGHKQAPQNSIPYVQVQDTLLAYQQIAAGYLRQINPTVVAITGSNGKTTVKDLVHSIAQKKFQSHATKGNFNNEIGVPRTILSMPEDTQVLVIELGIEMPGEMENLTAMVTPDIAILTNVGPVHLENYKNLKEIAKAKMEITAPMNSKGLFILNADDENLMAVYREKEFSPKTLTFGKKGVEKIQILSENPLRFSLNEEKYELSLFGQHQVYNASAAILAGLALGLSKEEIQEALVRPNLTKMRTDLKKTRGIKLLDDTYKSNPPSLLASLDTFAQIPADRHILILGDMLGLGEESQRFHRQIGEEICRRGYEYIIAYGSVAKEFLVPLKEQHTAFVPLGQTQEVEQIAKKWEIPNTAYFVKGSRSLKMEEIVEFILK